jgi:hypothetical protein
VQRFIAHLQSNLVNLTRLANFALEFNAVASGNGWHRNGYSLVNPKEVDKNLLTHVGLPPQQFPYFAKITAFTILSMQFVL